MPATNNNLVCLPFAIVCTLLQTEEAGKRQTRVLTGAGPMHGALIAEELGAAPPRWHLPVWPVWLLGALCECVCVPFKIEPPLYRRRGDFFIKSRAFDTSRARSELLYSPETTLRAGIRKTADWYSERGLL